MLRSLKNLAGSCMPRNAVYSVMCRFNSGKVDDTDAVDVSVAAAAAAFEESSVSDEIFMTNNAAFSSGPQATADIRTISIKHIFHPRNDYEFEGGKPRLRFTATDDFSLPEDFLTIMDKFQKKTDKTLLQAYSKNSADITHRRYTKPKQQRQADARRLMKKRRTREIVGLMRKAIDSNPKYAAIQKRIVERQKTVDDQGNSKPSAQTQQQR